MLLIKVIPVLRCFALVLVLPKLRCYELILIQWFRLRLRPRRCWHFLSLNYHFSKTFSPKSWSIKSTCILSPNEWKYYTFSFASSSSSDSFCFQYEQQRSYLSISFLHNSILIECWEILVFVTGNVDMHFWILQENDLHFCSQISASLRVFDRELRFFCW